MEALVRKLTPEQKARVEKSARKMQSLRRNVTRRARKQLLDISEREWNRLVSEANDES